MPFTRHGAVSAGITEDVRSALPRFRFTSTRFAASAAVLLAASVLAAEAHELDARARTQQLTALGRLRTPGAMDRLVQRLAAAPDVAEPAALALGVAARAKAPWPEAATPSMSPSRRRSDPTR